MRIRNPSLGLLVSMLALSSHAQTSQERAQRCQDNSNICRARCNGQAPCFQSCTKMAQICITNAFNTPEPNQIDQMDDDANNQDVPSHPASQPTYSSSPVYTPPAIQPRRR